MRNRIAFIIIGIFFNSVLWAQNFNEKTELEVINSIFLELIGTHYYYERPLVPPIPLEYCDTPEDSAFYFKRNKKIEEQRKNPKIDTSRLVIAFNDNLISFPGLYKETVENRIENPRFFVSDTVVFQDYIPLLRNLIETKINSSKEISLNEISNTGRYELQKLSEFYEKHERFPDIEEFKFIGNLMFSRVFFNQEYDKAVLYSDFLCGPLCGYGDLILVEYKDDKWIIVQRLNLWVA